VQGDRSTTLSGDGALAALLRSEALPVLQGCGCVAAAVVVVDGDQQAVLCLGEEVLGSGRRVTRDSLFSVASLSKAFVALTLARLADAGACSLEDPVRRWVPEVRWPLPVLDAKVTLRDVLGNRSGVGPIWPLDEMLDRELPVLDVLARLRHAPVRGPLRRHWAYLNLGFVAAAVACERIAGAPYHRVLAQQVLQPLGMRRSASWPGVVEAGWQPLAAHGGHPPRCLDGAGYVNHQGAGWMYLSPRDTVRWMRWWCTGRPALLAQKARLELLRSQMAVASGDAALWMAAPGATAVGYGFGWAHSLWAGEPMLQHSGATVGATAHVALLPRRGLGVAVFLSGGDLYRAALCYRLLERLQGCSASRDWLAIGRAALAAAGTAPAAALPVVSVDAGELQHCIGHYRGRACGQVRVQAEGPVLAMDFADAPAWSCRLHPLGGQRYAVELREPNEGLRFMRSMPPGQFVREGDRIVRFEHPWIETLQRIEPMPPQAASLEA
jgi:CubicO group peptidase (beta-lactamase class C family)